MLIIRKRHFNKKMLKCNLVKEILEKFTDNIFLTPYNYYDDYYIISILLNDIPVITNDNFYDHIYLLKNIDENIKEK